jgi:Flp pilus assembly protein CpaB
MSITIAVIVVVGVAVAVAAYLWKKKSSVVAAPAAPVESTTPVETKPVRPIDVKPTAPGEKIP